MVYNEHTATTNTNGLPTEDTAFLKLYLEINIIARVPASIIVLSLYLYYSSLLYMKCTSIQVSYIGSS